MRLLTSLRAFKHWITLNNALAGLFCASMNFIDSTRTTRPVMTFEPVGDHDHAAQERLHLLHGSLPREVVCTENLTPFLKLLPCKGKAGIASLLDGHKLFDATWQTMSIDVRPRCPADKPECIMEIEQTVDMILDIERSKRPRGDPIPRPLPTEDLICDKSKQYPGDDYCYPLDLSQTQEWSLNAIFGRTIRGTCLSTQNGAPAPPPVCIKARDALDVYTTGGAHEHRHPAASLRCLTIPDGGDFDVVVLKQAADRFFPPETPPLFAERSVTGHGQERGGVQALLANPSPDRTVEFVYFEALPWFMKPYLHTLKARVAGSETAAGAGAASKDVIQDMYYRPGLDRARGSQLELHMRVPPASTVILAYDFEKAILRYTEYPPDANRGRDVAPAVIRVLAPSESPSDASQGGATYLRTTSLMLPLPTPDFSMPYNVIILTSTVMALAFGNIFNVLVRRFVGADEAEGPDLKARVVGVVGAVVQWIRPRWKRGTVTDNQKKTN